MKYFLIKLRIKIFGTSFKKGDIIISINDAIYEDYEKPKVITKWQIANVGKHKYLIMTSNESMFKPNEFDCWSTSFNEVETYYVKYDTKLHC